MMRISGQQNTTLAQRLFSARGMNGIGGQRPMAALPDRGYDAAAQKHAAAAQPAAACTKAADG